MVTAYPLSWFGLGRLTGVGILGHCVVLVFDVTAIGLRFCLFGMRYGLIASGEGKAGRRGIPIIRAARYFT